MQKPQIFITRQIYPSALEKLQAECDVKVWQAENPPPLNVLMEHIQNSAGFITMLTDPINAQVLAQAGSEFQVIAQMAVGVDNIDLSAATELRIKVGHTPGVLTETTADLAWGLLMAAARRIVEAHNQVQNGIWKPWGPMVLCGQDIYGASLGIIGLGRIGQAVARRACGFGMRVLACSPQIPPELEVNLNLQGVDLDVLLKESDYISVHTYLSPQTYHLIARREFELMKSSAILINTARGAVVDPDALVWALQSGKITGAGLDVFEPEPIPSDSPLLHMPNVVITPHIASASTQTRLKMAEMCVENVLAALHGERIPYCANPEVYQYEI